MRLTPRRFDRRGDLIVRSSFLSEGPYRSSRPDTDQRVFLHELAVGHLAASKRHHQGMLPLPVVLSDLATFCHNPCDIPACGSINATTR